MEPLAVSQPVGRKDLSDRFAEHRHHAFGIVRVILFCLMEAYKTDE